MEGAVRVEGLRELRAAFKAADGESHKEIRRTLNEVADVVVRETKQRVPHRSGRLAGSVRASSTQTTARVSMGTARVPYAGFIEFGGRVGRDKSVRRLFVRGGRYMWPAVRNQRAHIARTFDEAMVRLLNRVRL